MMVAAQSVAPQFKPYNYWKLYMESVKGRLTSARVTRFIVNKEQHDEDWSRFSKKNWQDDTETDYDNDSETEKKQKKPNHLWRGEVKEVVLDSFGIPEFENKK
jgi:hypothetical protein